MKRILRFINFLLNDMVAWKKGLVFLLGLVVFVVPAYLTNEKAIRIEETDPERADLLYSLATAEAIAGFLAAVIVLLIISYFNTWYKQYLNEQIKHLM